MLLTDRVRSRGSILANTLKGNRRANFTVAHELGHFLLERHIFESAGFTCSPKDMRVNAGSSRHQQQEAEANEFAISLLAPPYRILPLLGSTPDLQDAVRLRNELDISLEASVRLLIDFRPEPIAAIWSKGGRVRYFVTSRAFPSVSVNPGEMLRDDTGATGLIAANNQRMSEFVKTPSAAWTKKKDIPMGEQTRLGRDGYAVTLLICGPL
ncbi:ImmA/IrrE family metallo-endopeptidase [Roseovarius arcticus]|uniref:ImmA/IrrE family metallo-endopeptidase n=1 Tax=Roseovarius arcticus TaxID=2547404 RepID=UPI001110C74A|nr:ImmA/IrrE family metallo-endopeptidase [Roseovarius arcticus]